MTPSPGARRRMSDFLDTINDMWLRSGWTQQELDWAEEEKPETD